MPLVLIDAQAPWGPISLKTAESMGEVLASGRAPAAVVDVGERDPADVVREALRMLPPPMDATGQIPATVDKARISVTEAVSRVSAWLAPTPSNPVSGKPEGHGGPTALEEDGEPEFAQQYADARAPETMTGNDKGIARRRKPGNEVDARAIRVGLGMSQPEFARAFGLKVATVRDWEQGRNRPVGAARVLLMTIDVHPNAVRDAVQAYG